MNANGAFGLKSASVPADMIPPASASMSSGVANYGLCSTGTHGPVSNGYYQFDLNAEASVTTPAHSDYADTLTWIATGTF